MNKSGREQFVGDIRVLINRRYATRVTIDGDDASEWNACLKRHSFMERHRNLDEN